MTDWQAYDSQITTKVKELVDSYVQSTHYLVYLNEIYNTNQYINNNLSKEDDKLNTLSDKARNNVYKAKQRYLSKVYNTHAAKFRSGVLRTSLFMSLFVLTIIAFAILGYMNQNMASVIVVILVLFYLLWLWLLIKDMRHRRKNDWNKYYFGTMDTKKRGSCPLTNNTDTAAAAAAAASP